MALIGAAMAPSKWIGPIGNPWAAATWPPPSTAEGQPLYLAINRGARKLNATTQSGQWKTWDAPG
jgi:hypothetical protein